jgi:hypothetical protein
LTVDSSHVHEKWLEVFFEFAIVVVLADSGDLMVWFPKKK